MILTAAFALVTFWNSAPDGWTSDFTLAMDRAHNEHKLVLINFTGSDWCVYCKKLEKEVFSTQEFKDWASKKFVLLHLDFPERHALPSMIMAQNDILKDRFKPEGFPSIYVVSPEKGALLKTGYAEGGASVWIQSTEQGISFAQKKMALAQAN